MGISETNAKPGAILNSVPVMVVGGFNDVPVGDTVFAKRDKVYPKNTLSSSTCPTKAWTPFEWPTPIYTDDLRRP